MSALALEAPQFTLAPVQAPRRRARAERAPLARPVAPIGPVCAPERVTAAAARPAPAACSVVAPAEYRLTTRGIAVITGSSLLLTATAVVTIVAQFLAIPA